MRMRMNENENGENENINGGILHEIISIIGANYFQEK